MENTPPKSRMWFRMNFTSGVFSSKTVVSNKIVLTGYNAQILTFSSSVLILVSMLVFTFLPLAL